MLIKFGKEKATGEPETLQRKSIAFLRIIRGNTEGKGM